MPIACTAPALSEAAKCFQCLTPRQLEVVQTYLLAVIAAGSPDPKVLMAEAKCFDCLTPKQIKDVGLYLLCQIANA
jgi:hypothetical protein